MALLGSWQESYIRYWVDKGASEELLRMFAIDENEKLLREQIRKYRVGTRAHKRAVKKYRKYMKEYVPYKLG